MLANAENKNRENYRKQFDKFLNPPDSLQVCGPEAPDVLQILDPPIRDAPAKELVVFNQVAVACCNLVYRERPTMKQVGPYGFWLRV